MAEAFSSGAAGGGGAGASDTQPPAVPGSGAAGGGGASSSGAQAVPEWPLVQCTSGKCSDPPVIEDQQQCVNVAQYHDEWTMSKSGSRMRAWYVCMMDGNGQWDPCGTIMPAKHWHRRFEDVGSSKQRWYCVCCGTRYQTKYGMLVEIHITSPEPTSVFMLSEISNQDVDDVRGMYLEHKLKPTDHKDLWEKIPDFTPMEPGDIMRPCREHEFAEREGFEKDLIYKFHNPAGVKDEVPRWDWDQIFTLVDEKPK
jgi:hypothetical protein